MGNAARRIYLEDGEIVLDVEDLVRHAVDNCKTEMVNIVLQERENREKKSRSHLHVKTAHLNKNMSQF